MSVFDRMGEHIRAVVGEERGKTRDAYQRIFTTPLGERVIADLKKYADHGKDVYYPGANVNDTIFLAGQQSVVNYILAMMEGGK